MTKDNFISLLKNPEGFTPELIAELKEMTEQYPYFAHPHLLLAKAMHQTNDLQSEVYLKRAGIYAADRRNLYYLLHPDKAQLSEPLRTERDSRISGNYFDMIDKFESQGGDAKQSLKSLAEKLKAAREAISVKQETTKAETKETNNPNHIKPEHFKPVRIPTPDYFQLEEQLRESEKLMTEEYAKKLIKERKYSEAIAILNELNLIYPKKSIYFADQIRFLEKILINTKKRT
jgi:hypothetical protein